MNKVTARFYVRAVEKYSNEAQNGFASPAPRIVAKLSPVSGNRSEANKTWASATPSGSIELTVGNPAAAAWFESMLGKDVAITFEERSIQEHR